MKTLKNKRLLFPTMILAFLLPSMSQAQTLVDVQTSGTTFSPAAITIDVGDTVRWTNTGGSHNVNGTQATYPANPESFGNSVGTGWVFEHVFTIPGSYTYQCDPHVELGMKGTVTVTGPSATADKTVPEKLIKSVFPSPAATGQVTVELAKDPAPGTVLVVFDLNGTELARISSLTGRQATLDTTGWAKGLYYFQLRSGNDAMETGSIVVQ